MNERLKNNIRKKKIMKNKYTKICQLLENENNRINLLCFCAMPYSDTARHTIALKHEIIFLLTKIPVCVCLTHKS